MSDCCPCYEQIVSPSFFYGEGDCDTTNHDLKVNSGDLEGGNDVISAALIQLGTDSRFDNERGWWGDQFMPFPIGNELWSIRKQGITALKVDELVRKAIDPLIRTNQIDDLRVDAVKTVEGVDVDVELLVGNRSIFSVTI
jgi:phage gp46-like protein